MKKLLLIGVCCLCLCGCDNKSTKTTICKNGNEHIITIKHSNNIITYYKNEYQTNYNTITEAIEEEQQWEKNLICTENFCYSPLEGENGWKYTIKRDNKTIFLIQEIENYNGNYIEEIEYLESLPKYLCSEQ